MSADQLIESYVSDVVRRLPGRQRADVAIERQALLREELARRVEDRGEAPDEASPDVALTLLSGFGRPAEEASRYRPTFNIIDPVDSRVFLKPSVIGVALIWFGEGDTWFGGQGARRRTGRVVDPASGVVAGAELVARLGVCTALDDAVGEIKQRDRGLSAGQFQIGVAQMFGAQFWTGLDRRRAETAGEALSAVATPASTTAVQLADRFGPAQVAGIEEGMGGDLLPGGGAAAGQAAGGAARGWGHRRSGRRGVSEKMHQRSALQG
jgi:hypothetical protein